MSSDEDADAEFTRREVMRSAGAAAATMPAFLGLSGTDTSSMSPLLKSGVGVRSFELPDWSAGPYGGRDDPGVSFQYDEGYRDSLQSWLDSSSKRRLIDEYEPARVATVAAPPSDLGLGGSFLNGESGLIQRDWVAAADLNLRANLHEPVTPRAADAVDGLIDRSSLSWTERQLTSPIDATGVAYEGDYDETPIADARAAMHADTDALGSLPDTSGLTIAVIDSGVNTADGTIFGTDGDGEPRLLGASKDFVDADQPTVVDEGSDVVSDPNGHGSWVAPCITASPNPDSYGAYRGFCPDADVLALRALDKDGGGETAAIANAVRYATDEGADVICLSLGSPNWSLDLETAMEHAVENGAVPVAAAGNDRQVTTWEATPASSDHVIGVGATTVAPPADALSANFSNVGPNPGSGDLSGGETTGARPDVGAPGTALGALTADESGNVDVERLTGTSMAAPCVAGVVGLLIASGEVSGFEDVRTRLTETARPIPAAGEYEVGYGMPSAKHAIDNAAPDETQADARNNEAVARDRAYAGYSDVQGRRFFGLI